MKRTTLFVVLISALLFLALAIAKASLCDSQPPLIWSGVVALYLLALIAYDIEVLRLPDYLTLSLAALGILYVTVSGQSVFRSLAGGVFGYGVLWGVRAYWRHTKGYEGLGLGDAKLLCASGCWLGLSSIPVVLFIASLLGILHFSIGGRQYTEFFASKPVIPFGPSIAISFWGVCSKPAAYWGLHCIRFYPIA